MRIAFSLASVPELSKEDFSKRLRGNGDKFLRAAGAPRNRQG